jgi:DNA-binding CsgD family transcriptional regulator
VPKSGHLPLVVADDDPASRAVFDVPAALKLSASLSHLDPMRNALTRPGEIVSTEDIGSREELERNEFFVRVMRPFGVEHAIGMHICEPSGWAYDLGLINGPGQPAFGAAHKQLFVEIRPHLERALALYARIQRNESERRILAEAFDRLTIGTFILNAEGKVIGSNRVGREIARSHLGIRIVDHRIRLLREKDNAQLSALIEGAIAALGADTGTEFVEALRVDCSSSAGFGLLVRSLRLPTGHANDAGPSIAVYVSSSHADELPLERFVAKLFGLTRSEAHLATLLANGLTMAEAAVRLEITEQSVRSYSKNLYRKVGVSRQTDLVRSILRSVAVLA